MLPTADCDDCTPTHNLRRSLEAVPPSTIVWSSIPFVLTWVVIAILAQQRLFPRLSSDEGPKGGGSNGLPQFNRNSLKPSTRGLREKLRLRQPSAQRVASLVFSTSIGLSAVLVELLLCEISDTLNPAVRGLALRLTLSSLLLLTIIVTPALEIHGLAKTILGTPTDSTSTRRTKPTIRFALEVALFAAWLLTFWILPQASVLSTALRDSASDSHELAFSEACLERIGIIGISLMASLAGFAAVSSLWQNFGVRHRPVHDQDLSRKEAGLTATSEMLAAKQSRLRALQRKISESPASTHQSGFFTRVVGSLRGSSPETQELQSLQIEISGLETMRFTLATSLSHLRARSAQQSRSKTHTGKLLNLFNSLFACYCAYRICATSLSTLRRWWAPSHASFAATADPINNVLALLTTHWDSNLDRAAWSRQISFLLSGIMLLASFNAVLQTFRLFARFAPSLLQHAQTSLPLIISQIAGTYVVASALLLRSNLPAEVGGVISEALGAPLEAKFVERWFEGWFLVAVVLTALGILVGRKVGGVGAEEWEDEDGGWEGGKRC
ncbi:hypothetical protein B0A50_08480 [Salinomyces thailandicus]|uniref:Uncharacterized protein n=1 Tax=Salinomyces thailandicus TaxID=706561 RepID=A0A4U0TK89_9PEZI|nr:hypothetical protein B0A50_08480 [Salinomyces thailandica]